MRDIYDACHYFRLFQHTSFAKYCGIITSYEPNATVISKEPPHSDERYKYDTYNDWVLKGFPNTAAYETEMKRRFIEEPSQLKLLIVVSKLLTGFDAPSCTYIYLDSIKLRDHNLFQAICRTNRLDGDDKTYGHIVDYKELFQNVQNSIAVYTSDEIDTETCGKDGNVVLKDWLQEGRKKLDEAREVLLHLCEPVSPPREQEQFLRYFCGNAADEATLSETEPLRIAFYKATASFLRAYADIASHMEEAGYSVSQIWAIQDETTFYTDIRAAIKHHSGEELDVKAYEADMRHLINTYVQANHAEHMGVLGGLSLTELIVETGINDAIAKKLNSKGKLSKNSIAEGIINNLRKTIIRDQLTDPRFYEQMSRLLLDLIRMRREETRDYEAFLKQAEELAQQIVKRSDGDYPASLRGNPEAIFVYRYLADLPGTAYQCPENGLERTQLAQIIDQTLKVEAPAEWRGDQPKESAVKNHLHRLLSKDAEATRELFDLIKNSTHY